MSGYADFKTPQHGRDHEHGGADPMRIEYEDVGTGGGGGDGGTGGSGITFDTVDPATQEGQWLYVGTYGPATSDYAGVGIEFDDFGGGGIRLDSAGGGDLTLHVSGGGLFRVDSTDDIVLDADQSLRFSAGDSAFLSATNDVELLGGYAGGHGDLGVTGAGANDTRVRVEVGKISFLHAGSPVLTVDNIGGTVTYHVLSGAAWVADL